LTENKEKNNYCEKNWKLVNFCEFDKYATKSYCAIHNVDESLNLGDITKVDETKLEPFNMICGGSPCQDFSVAGKQKGSVWTCKDCGHKYNPLTVHWSERDKCPCCGSNNIEKTRSSLLVEYLRVIRANKPNFGMYENVKNIVGKQFKDTFKMFTDELDEYGYNVYWKVLNAKDYGIPQNRERVYMIFIKKELDNDKFEFPKPFNKDLKVKDLLEDVVDEKFYIDDERVKEMISKAKGSPYANKKANFNLFDGASSYAIRSQEFVRTGFTEDSSTLAARDYKDPHCVVVGKLNSSQDGVVVSSEGIVPTLTAGHSNTPKVLHNNRVAIKQATKKGYIECEVGGVADLSYPTSKTRRGRVQDGGNISPTITATETGVCKIDEDLRVRKVTPKECFRLMGFPDSAYQAAHDCGVSNTQLYKQAGNSIVVDVLYYILKELYNAMPYLFDDLQLSSYFSGIGAFEIALDRLFKDINTGNFTKSQMV
jgi:DNA (cytosine-5)-methyltransferase 1